MFGECRDNCNFSLWSPVDAGGFVEDRAFSCCAQAMEGDFTVGQAKLKEFCQSLANLYHSGEINEEEINEPAIHQQVANALGFDFNSLLDEEVNYCINLLEGMLMEC